MIPLRPAILLQLLLAVPPSVTAGQLDGQILADLQKCNPSFKGAVTSDINSEGTIHLQIQNGSTISDLTPLQALPLGSLTLRDAPISAIQPLQGKRLTAIDLRGCRQINDFSALEKMPLTSVRISCQRIHDIGFLKNAPLEILTLEDCANITDFSPIANAPLKHVWFSGTSLSNLNTLSGRKLLTGFFSGRELKDISALQGMPMTSIEFQQCKSLSDLSPLLNMPLERIVLWGSSSIRDISPLRNAKLTEVNFEGTGIRDLSPLQDQKIVSARLCCPVLDLSPLRGMPMQHVDVGGATGNDKNISDLSPLAGMTAMLDLRFDNTSVANISVVGEMKKLKYLAMFNTNVTDLTALRGLQLEQLFFDPRSFPAEQLQMIREMKSLRTIETSWHFTQPQSAEEFWRRYDAGEYR